MRTVTVLFFKTFGPIVIAEEIRFFMRAGDAIAKLFQSCTDVTPVACIPATILSFVIFIFFNLIFITEMCLLIFIFFLCLTPKTQLYAAWRAMACLSLAWRYISQI